MPSSWDLEKSRSVHGLLLQESLFGQAGPARGISILCFADPHHECPQRQPERAAQQWAPKSVPAGGRWRVGIGPAMAREWSNPSSLPLAARWVFQALEVRAPNSRSEGQRSLSVMEPLATGMGSLDPCALSS